MQICVARMLKESGIFFAVSLFEALQLNLQPYHSNDAATFCAWDRLRSGVICIGRG
jgi:hypothetical protein